MKYYFSIITQYTIGCILEYIYRNSTTQLVVYWDTYIIIILIDCTLG